MPEWMRSAGVWLSALFGEMPLIAPMVVSGWYTFHVGTQALNLPWAFAFLLVCALEGGAFKLAVLYRKRLVEGISTIAERLGLIVVVAAIGGLIYWHATTKVAAGTDAELGEVLQAADWRPAAVAAAMAAFGVYINGRAARWDHREELRKAGRLDMQALRIGVWQWLVSPWESAWSFRHGMKYRIANPAEAARDWNLWRDAGRPKVWPPALADVAGTGTAPVQVPRWLLDTLTAGTGTGPSVGINPGTAIGRGTGTAHNGTAPGTGTTGTGGAGTAIGRGTGTGTGGTGTGSPSPDGTNSRTAVNSAGADSDLSGTGAAGTGTDITDEEVAAWRERHRERLVTVRANLRSKVDPGADWSTASDLSDLPLAAICAAGAFANKIYAREIKAVLLHDRREMDDRAALSTPTASAAG